MMRVWLITLLFCSVGSAKDPILPLVEDSVRIDELTIKLRRIDAEKQLLEEKIARLEAALQREKGLNESLTNSVSGLKKVLVEQSAELKIQQNLTTYHEKTSTEMIHLYREIMEKSDWLFKPNMLAHFNRLQAAIAEDVSKIKKNK